MIVSEILQSYLDQHISEPDPYLLEVERKTYLNELQPHMLSGMHQAFFLSQLVALKNPKHLLEIGTFTGFAAIAMAKQLNSGSKIITIEKDPEMVAKAKANIEGSDVKDKIIIKCGDAALLLPDLLKEFNFEMAFIDADKAKNKEYYDVLVDNLPSTSLILIDNVLWKGRVFDPLISDNTTRSFRDLNDYITHDSRVLACILPIRDGIWMVQKK